MSRFRGMRIDMNFGRPSHDVVVAYLALFVAMNGTAVAATRGTMRSIIGDTGTALSRARTAPLGAYRPVGVG